MNLKLVILDDFFANSQDESAQEYFAKLVGMKKAGYWSKHNSNYLPFTQNDFICTHVFLVDTKSEDIVLAFKLVPQERCELYSIMFTMEEYLVGEDKAKTKNLRNRLSQNNHKYSNLTYSGGWTVNPKFKGLGKSDELKEIYTGIHYLVNNYLKTEMFMGIGVMNFKTHLFFQNIWGMKEMDSEIFNFASCSYLDCKFYELDMKQASFQKRQLAKKYKSIWRDALIINGKSSVKKVS